MKKDNQRVVRTLKLNVVHYKIYVSGDVRFAEAGPEALKSISKDIMRGLAVEVKFYKER